MFRKLDDVIKLFRRGTHVFRDKWHAIIFAKTELGLKLHYEEVLKQLMDSSVGVAAHSEVSRRIETAKGSTIQFALAETADDVRLRMAGAEVTQVIWLHRPTDEAMRAVRTYLRSATVPPEQYKMDVVDHQ